MKVSRSSWKVILSLYSSSTLSLRRSSSCSDVVWQYSAVLRITQAVRISCMFARPSADLRDGGLVLWSQLHTWEKTSDAPPEGRQQHIICI